MIFLENSLKQNNEIRPDPCQCTIVTASSRCNTAGSDIYAFLLFFYYLLKVVSKNFPKYLRISLLL